MTGKKIVRVSLTTFLLSYAAFFFRIQEAPSTHQEEVGPGHAIAEEASEGLPAVDCRRSQRPEARGSVHEGLELPVQTAGRERKEVRVSWHGCCLRLSTSVAASLPPVKPRFRPNCYIFS